MTWRVNANRGALNEQYYRPRGIFRSFNWRYGPVRSDLAGEGGVFSGEPHHVAVI